MNNRWGEVLLSMIIYLGAIAYWWTHAGTPGLVDYALAGAVLASTLHWFGGSGGLAQLLRELSQALSQVPGPTGAAASPSFSAPSSAPGPSLAPSNASPSSSTTSTTSVGV